MNAAPASKNVAAVKAPMGGPLAILDHAIAAGMIGLLLYGPLALGVVEPWSVFLLRILAALLLLLWAARQAIGGELRIVPSSLYPPLLAFACLVLFQMLAGWTAYYQATMNEAANYAAYGFIFFLATQIFSTERYVSWLLWSLATFGFLLALFAIVQDLTFNGKIYWVRDLRVASGVYGPYVNHNHYAGLMELLMPIPLALALSRRSQSGKRWLLAFMAIVMASTIFLSLSRAGMVSVLCQLLFLSLFLFRSDRSPTRPLALGALATGTLVFALLIGTGELVKRVSSLQNPTDDSVAGLRLAVLSDSPAMIAQKPILGWGLGTFPTVYPRFRTTFSDRFVNQAHNDYLQVLIETGILGFTAMAWFLVVLYRTSLRELRRDTGRLTRTARLAALTGITGLLVHSLADFNLHIPANAAMFFALCALASLQSKPRELLEPA